MVTSEICSLDNDVGAVDDAETARWFARCAWILPYAECCNGPHVVSIMANPVVAFVPCTELLRKIGGLSEGGQS